MQVSRFFKSSKSLGFDYHSFYFLIRDVGLIESLVIGDFEINMGQGLIHWQSAAFKKSSLAVNPLRESFMINPHKGVNEQMFHRGVAANFKMKKLTVGFFTGFNYWDGNVKIDSGGNGKAIISSIQVNGLHRTENELADKKLTTCYGCGRHHEV